MKRILLFVFVLYFWFIYKSNEVLIDSDVSYVFRNSNKTNPKINISARVLIFLIVWEGLSSIEFFWSIV